MNDDAFDRLRAADPASGTEPDLDAIRAAVTGATGVPLSGAATPGDLVPAGAPAGWVPAERSGPDELAPRRPRRADWLRAAAAVAAVAVVGAGGYLAAGGAGGGSTTTTSGALPAISLDGKGASGAGAGNVAAPATAGGTGSAASAASAPARGDAAFGSGQASPYVPGYGGGRTVFSGPGLSTATGSAKAWAFDASAVASAGTVARVAAKLGVTGTPKVQWGSWVVGPNDGSGPTVSLDGSGNVSYYDPGRDPWQCQAGVGSVGGGKIVPPMPPVNSAAPDSASSGSAPDAKPLPTPANPSVCAPGTTPTGAAATARARAALTAVGIDTSGTQVQADDTNDKAAGSSGAAYVYRSFQQVIDGRLTGVSWSVTLVGDGVQSLSGPLAPLVSLGTYGVISPAAAVDRLNDPRFGASGGVYPMAAGIATGSGTVASAPYPVASPDPQQTPTTPPAPKAGAAISWPVQRVTLVSAQLGLALTYQPSGAQVLVPAYVLTDTTGATWSVVAVADAQLDFAAK